MLNREMSASLINNSSLTAKTKKILAMPNELCRPLAFDQLFPVASLCLSYTKRKNIYSRLNVRLTFNKPTACINQVGNTPMYL